MIRYPIPTLGALLVLAGCGTIANGGDVAARITNPSAMSRAALRQAVNDALYADVLIADDALTESSLLVIERKPPQNLQNIPATGRNMDPPIQFRLVLHMGECILVDTRDGSRRPLEDTTCAAE